MNKPNPQLKNVIQWINEHNIGNDNNYILCKQDTDEAIRKLDADLRYREYLDVGSVFNWFYNEFEMYQADSDSLYRPFIALENDNIIQLRISRHYNTRDAVRNTYTKGTIIKPSFEYHVIIERINIIYSNANKQVIRRNTCIRQVPIYVTEMSFEDFSDGDKLGKFIDKLIYILTKGVVPSVKESKQNNKTKNKIEENMRNKQMVRLNESQLRQIVRESVKNVLRETYVNKIPKNWKETEFSGTYQDEDGAIYMPDEDMEGYEYMIVTFDGEEVVNKERILLPKSGLHTYDDEVPFTLGSNQALIELD